MSPVKLVKGSQNYVWFSDQRLGKGAMGTVYLARHRRKGIKRAAKTFNPQDKMTEFIHKELSILREMEDHEHIVKLEAIEEETYSKDNVVIMELCDGGSLQRILDEPENYNGMAHDEWLLVFTHTFKALRHLHDNGIVHRDIKPGNILLHTRPDGRHIYKLTDFGAARKLAQDEEGFKSLCGTEEYLHPEVHSSAFVRRIPGQVYGHYVDIWSFGVTMYQCATGRLPFRPREGVRKNRHLMNDLMTNKAHGVISKYEREDGQIVEEKHLPPTCRLFSGTRQQVERALARVFDLTEPWSAPEFFTAMTDFCDKALIYVYSINMNNIICIHLNQTDSMAHLAEEITRYTDIPASNQILLTKDCPLAALVTPGWHISDYPLTSPDDPICVIDRNLDNDGTNTPMFEDIPSLPEPGTRESILVSDARWAAQVCGNIHHFMYLTRYLVWIQCHLLSLRTSLNDMVNQLCQIIEHSMQRQEQIQDYLRKLMIALCLHVSRYHSSWAKQSSIGSLRESLDRHQKTRHDLHRRYDRVQDSIKRFAPLIKKGQKPSCALQDRCREKGEVLLKDSVPLYEGIQQDKTKRELPHNDMEIHKYNRAELKRIHRRFHDYLKEHCVQQANLQYQETGDFCRLLLEVWEELKCLEAAIVAFDTEQKHYGSAILRLLSEDDTNEVRDTTSSSDVPGSSSHSRRKCISSTGSHAFVSNHNSPTTEDVTQPCGMNESTAGNIQNHSLYRHRNPYSQSGVNNSDVTSEPLTNARIVCDSSNQETLGHTMNHDFPHIAASIVSGSGNHFTSTVDENARRHSGPSLNISNPDLGSAMEDIRIADTLFDVDACDEVDFGS